jgi:hypothetical protein
MNDYQIFLNAAECGNLAVVELLLQNARVDPSAYDNYAVRWAAHEGHLAVVRRLLQDARVDPSANDNHAIGWAAQNGHLAVVERLLQDPRVDPSVEDNGAVRWAAVRGQLAVVDRLFRVPSVYTSINLPAERINHIGMIRSRVTEVCKALQELGLPTLLTLGILDELIPNEIRMWAKWELVTAVKHFHQRQEKKLLLKE